MLAWSSSFEHLAAENGDKYCLKTQGVMSVSAMQCPLYLQVAM